MSKTSSDPIADMLTRIRNAVAVSKAETLVPHSKVKEAIATALVKAGFIKGVEIVDLSVGKMLKVQINPEDSNSRITEIKRLSSPGRRYYVGADKIPTVKRGRGIVLISTSKGIMTGDEAKESHLGGELICKVI
ncbi:MAG: 30S ribosomal protein S8 [bacterium]|nr:30S ribosomal protein S8 [bacterium]